MDILLYIANCDSE